MDLKPCPFCGSNKHLIELLRDYERISCLTCGASGPKAKHIYKAIKLWNSYSDKNENIGEFRKIAKEQAESAALDIFEKFINNQENHKWLNRIKYPGVRHKVYVIEKIAEIITTAIIIAKNENEKHKVLENENKD